MTEVDNPSPPGNPSLANLCVVLVEPQGDLNIGSVCRAMANFGVCQLRLVAPQVDHLSDGARRMAVKAGGLLEQAEIYPDLDQALADTALAIGTTRRFGKYREDLLNPDQAAAGLLPLAERGRVALVFGREDKGLLTEELDRCQWLMTIPTSAELASMNLAQAVAVTLYEIYQTAGRLAGKSAGRKRLASGKTLERMYRHMRQSLLDIEFLDPQNPDHILRSFRRIFGRAGLNDREVRIIQGLWSRIDWVCSQWKRRGETP